MQDVQKRNDVHKESPSKEANLETVQQEADSYIQPMERPADSEQMECPPFHATVHSNHATAMKGCRYPWEKSCARKTSGYSKDHNISCVGRLSKGPNRVMVVTGCEITDLTSLS